MAIKFPNDTSPVTVLDSDIFLLADASDSNNLAQVTALNLRTYMQTGTITPSSSDVLTNKTIDTANNTITVVEADISDLGTTVAMIADNLSVFAVTSSAQLAGVISDETGSGSLVFGTSPILVTPDLGTPSDLVGTNITGTASGLTAGNVTTNADLTGIVTSTGNVTSIADKAVAISKLADGTDGELITWSALGVVETIAAGLVGEVLTSNGAGSAPTFQAADGGSWQPPPISLGDFLANGASAFLNTGAGFQWSFSQTADDEIVCQIALDNNGVAYDGSSLKLRLHWEAFSTAPTGGDTVKWEVDYAFVESDGTDNPGTIVDGNNVDDIDISSRTASLQYEDDLSTMTGKSGAKTLNITLRRNSSGGGADSYGNAADLFGIEIIKV